MGYVVVSFLCFHFPKHKVRLDFMSETELSAAQSIGLSPEEEQSIDNMIQQITSHELFPAFFSLLGDIDRESSTADDNENVVDLSKEPEFGIRYDRVRSMLEIAVSDNSEDARVTELHEIIESAFSAFDVRCRIVQELKKLFNTQMSNTRTIKRNKYNALIESVENRFKVLDEVLEEKLDTCVNKMRLRRISTRKINSNADQETSIQQTDTTGSDYIQKVLYGWFYSHFENPFPSKAQKEALCRQTKMTMKQLDSWFSNRRQRFWKPHKVKSKKS
jgi:hypothetical protein